MFEPDKEVIANRSTEECIQLLSRYLQNDQRRAGIAGAGQERTLKEHTYLQRMEEIVGIVQRYL
jgi:spore maturation protein CgeB